MFGLFGDVPVFAFFNFALVIIPLDIPVATPTSAPFVSFIWPHHYEVSDSDIEKMHELLQKNQLTDYEGYLVDSTMVAIINNQVDEMLATFKPNK